MPLSSYGRCRVENPVEPRRSLRILAKQKLKEEQASQLSQPDRSPEKQRASERQRKRFTPRTSEKGVKEAKTAQDNRKGKGRRKRNSSPSTSSPSSKRAKKDKQGVGEVQKVASSSESLKVVKEGPSSEGEDGGRRYPKRRQSKEELCNSSNRERESVIVYPRKRKAGKGNSSAETLKQEQSTSAAEFEKKGQSKGRLVKSRGKARNSEEKSKGKSRGEWSSPNYYSLPSLVDFTKLNMASPE